MQSRKRWVRNNIGTKIYDLTLNGILFAMHACKPEVLALSKLAKQLNQMLEQSAAAQHFLDFQDQDKEPEARRVIKNDTIARTKQKGEAKPEPPGRATV